MTIKESFLQIKTEEKPICKTDKSRSILLKLGDEGIISVPPQALPLTTL